MDSDGLEGFDFSQPLHYALSQLHGGHLSNDYLEEEDEEEMETNYYPKPASLSAMANEDDSDQPLTTIEIIEQLLENLEFYPKTVQIMMQRGLLRKQQLCKKCDRKMTLRRRKNCYEWRCRTKDKKGDCSSCSIKYGSWFEYTKLPFKTVINFLVMHCKMFSLSHIVDQLKLSSHTINDVRRFIYELTDRIESRYPKIGQNNQEVFMELITVRKKATQGEMYQIAAGKEVGSNRCFAHVLPESTLVSFEAIKNLKVAAGANVRMIKSVQEEDSIIPNVTFYDEATHYPNPADRFFLNLRKDPPEHVFTNRVLQSWLNDEVVRKVEGKQLLVKCVEELTTYTK